MQPALVSSSFYFKGTCVVAVGGTRLSPSIDSDTPASSICILKFKTAFGIKFINFKDRIHFFGHLKHFCVSLEDEFRIQLPPNRTAIFNALEHLEPMTPASGFWRESSLEKAHFFMEKTKLFDNIASLQRLKMRLPWAFSDDASEAAFYRARGKGPFS